MTSQCVPLVHHSNFLGLWGGGFGEVYLMPPIVHPNIYFGAMRIGRLRCTYSWIFANHAIAYSSPYATSYSSRSSDASCGNRMCKVASKGGLTCICVLFGDGSFPAKWDGFEAAFKKAISLRGDVKGLTNHWLARDQSDPDAGYSITLWDNEADMHAFWDSKKREEAMALLRPFFLNQFTVPQCEVRFSQRE